MTEQRENMVFLSYAEDNRDFVETLARRLHGDARLSFWLREWHSRPGKEIQYQMEQALAEAASCAVFISSNGIIQSWQNEQMRAAIQTQVEDDPDYRVIPVYPPGAPGYRKSELPSFLRLYEPVEFQAEDDERAFQRLLAGILGVRPVDVQGFIATKRGEDRLPMPSGLFQRGHALVIGVANYPMVTPLPEAILNDARDFAALLTDPEVSGHPASNVRCLLDTEATRARIREELQELARRTGPDDIAILFFSGHGARTQKGNQIEEYILPYDSNLADLAATALSSDEMTELLHNIRAGRLLVLFDSCHSGGLGDPKDASIQLKAGLSETFYETAAGRGRVIIASSRAEEVSWVLPGARNSLFTHHLLSALRGGAKTLGDGYVRVFDLFRHVARHVPIQRAQHPIFKAAFLEEDFPVAHYKETVST